MVAYDRLTGEGFLTSHVGAGTFVSDDVAMSRTDGGAPEGALRPRPVWSTVHMPFTPAAGTRFDLRCGLPDFSRFPYESWRRLTASELRLGGVGRAKYGEPAGHPALRAAIARHIGVSRAVRATADDIIVTNGFQQAMDVIARVLLAPGDRVAVEDPGYPPPRGLLETMGMDVVAVPVDDEGIVVDAIPAGVRAVLVTPSHHFPLGHTMSLRRRLALLRWAEREDAAIVEDDYDSEFRFGGRPIEPLQRLDGSGRVLYTGSFSKTMLPSLRLGFIVTPASLRPGPAGGQVRHRLVDVDAAAARPRPVHRPGMVRPPPAGDALALPGAPRADLGDAARRPGERAQGDPVRRRAAPRARWRRGCPSRMPRWRSASAPHDGVVAYPLASFGQLEPRPVGVVLGYGAVQLADIPEALRRLARHFGHDRAGCAPHPIAGLRRLRVAGARSRRSSLVQTLDVRSAQYGARSSRLSSLPEPVFGSSSIQEIERGTL